MSYQRKLASIVALAHVTFTKKRVISGLHAAQKGPQNQEAATGGHTVIEVKWFLSRSAPISMKRLRRRGSNGHMGEFHAGPRHC